MASLGNALVNKILGHSEAEKAFRPWWDNLEDFLVYGLVMLGLIVAPTAIINGTPLDCNFCTEDGCKDYFERTNTSHRDAEPPDYNFWWVKKYCTMTAVDGFILYFPIFQAGLKLEAFYSLIQKDIEETQEDFSSTNQDVEESINNKTAIEPLYYLHGLFLWVSQVCKETNSYIAMSMGITMNVQDIPRNSMCSLSRVMSKYRTMLRKRYDGNEDTTILGELHWIYFNNRDLKLLLDLLATSSGVSQSISLLTLFDQSLRQKCVASHLKIHRDGSRATMKDLSCIYTVQIHPPTINSSVQALKFSSNKSFKEYATDIEMQPLDHSREVRTATFTDLNEGQEYIFRVSTLVNGHPIAKKILQ
ncbi:LRRC8 [Lepeophtheirus salmonis]|uniref:LRRC8 n=1 Tax=Lepeophtheirus salmonis TaxID=72036 RepID=A0A7R8D5K8_LEPSM|nr:LRRC8 [Lepeophtheirus salmonis]CAF3031288.1 LRRC8 [Lepeophtheirus salmonis]